MLLSRGECLSEDERDVLKFRLVRPRCVEDDHYERLNYHQPPVIL